MATIAKKTKAKKPANELIMRADGFYLGRVLKDGTLSKSARKITASEIVTMFAAFFSAYCAHNGVTEETFGKDGEYQFTAKEL